MAISFANLFCYVDRTVEETPHELTLQGIAGQTGDAVQANLQHGREE
jgi:hypothetical protein